MNLWGVAPLLAVALIGGSSTAHTASIYDFAPGAAHQGANQVRLAASTIAATGPGADQASAEWSFATMTAVLNQTASGSWQVAALVNTANGQCPAASDFWLETDSPHSPFQASTAPGGLASAPAGSASKGTAANICNMTVTFTGLGQIPATAALVLDEPGGPASLQLSVSRNVPVFWYLGIPALAGVLMVVLLLTLCMARVKVYDKVNNTDSKLSPWKPEYWRYRIFASGAWTLNDSWATNIASVVGVLGIILTTTSAVNSLFPGVALDRFAIVNACAAAIATAAPLVFGALYALWTHRNPGITADATVALPAHVTAGLARQNGSLPDRTACDASLLRSTQVTAAPPKDTVTPVPANRSVTLDVGASINLDVGTKVALTDRNPICLAEDSRAKLSAGTTTALAAGTDVLVGNGSRRRWDYQVPVQLAEAADATLAEGTAVVPSACQWTRVSGGAQAKLQAQTTVTLPDGSTGKLVSQTTAELSAGATAMLLQPCWVTLAGRQATIAAAAQGTLAEAIDSWPQGTEVTIPEGTGAKLGTAARARLAEVSYGSAAEIRLSDGATIAVPGGAAIGAADNVDRWPVQVLAAKTIQVPLESRIEIRGDGVMALPGNPDVLVKGESTFYISHAGGAEHDLADDGRAVTIAGSDTASAAQSQPAANDKAPQSDVIMQMPTFVTAPAGAKITVVGAADVMLPIGTEVTAPRRKNFPLPRTRHIQLPQNSNNMLVANMFLAVISALVTIFGVGAEIGIAGMLWFKLSDASGFGDVAGLILTILLAFFALWYSHTAIRALADPQPGSSISAASGSSFTL